MRLFSFFVLVLVLWLATCSGPQPNVLFPDVVPTQTSPPPTVTPLPPTPEETMALQSKLPAAPFDAETYINEEAGFAFEYPSGWTVNEMTVGSRGSQTQFLSDPALAEAASIPEGETKLSATVYQWDPKNDLAAYVENRKNAWSASGFTILEEQPLALDLGLPAVQFTLQTPDAQAVFLLIALGDQYLELAGEGDLELVKQIVQRVRPISS
jgi:hypothetical protein